MADLKQVEESLRLMAELGIKDTSSKTEYVNSNNKDFAGITPYNVAPASFYKIADYAKKGVYTFNMPYAKASTPEEEKAGKNILTPFSDPELDREIVPTSIKAYAVEYNDAHEWSEYKDEKFTSHCKVIGQKVGDDVTNEPIIIPVKWQYKAGSTNGYKVPSDALVNTNAVGSRGMTCADCIKQGCNVNPSDTKDRCKEKGTLVLYITHLGVLNKKTKTTVYTPVSEIYFASSWDLANGKTTPIEHQFLPAYMNLSGSYIAGSFGDKDKGIEPIDGFGSFFEKVRKASSNFFNIVQWKLVIDVIPNTPANNLSFVSDGGYVSTELAPIIQHWNDNKPEFVETRVPFNKFTTELRGNYVPPSAEATQQQQEEIAKATDLSKF
jgi:hypothetical protein